MPDIVVPSTWRDRLEIIAGRRRQVWALAVVAGIAVAIGLGLWLRSPPKIAPPARIAAPPVASVAASPQQSPAALLVHVAGAVVRPGLYELDAGARVADAIDAARGPRARADLDALNLAEPLTDGQKLEVPTVGEAAIAAPVVSPTGSIPGAAPAGSVIDINTADGVALETIPGIGPVKAQAILDYRTEIGSFSSVDQLMEVNGIGPATLEAIRPYVTV